MGWKATEPVWIKGRPHKAGNLPDGVTPEQWQITRGLVVETKAKAKAKKG